MAGGGQEMGWRSGLKPYRKLRVLESLAELAAQELSAEAKRLTGLRESLVWLFAHCPYLTHWRSSASSPPSPQFLRQYSPHARSRTHNGQNHRPTTQPRRNRFSAGAACSSGKLPPVRFCWRWAIVLLRHWAVFASPLGTRHLDRGYRLGGVGSPANFD